MSRLFFMIIVLIVACRSDEALSNKIPAVQSKTQVVISCDTLNYVLDVCSATLNNEKLKLYIERNTDSLSNYAIEIYQKDKNFEIVVSQPWSVTDSSYVAPRFKILNQKLILANVHYKPNENVQGELNLLMLGHKGYFRETEEMKLRESWDTVRCFGVFSSIIK